MKALFQARRPRTSHRRRTHRTGLAAVCVAAERLEPRQMLAADGLRPLLAPASMLVMDASMGPNPVVMSKSQVVGTDVKSFVISHVPEGSVVEKWDAAKDQWIDVSTMPTSSKENISRRSPPLICRAYLMVLHAPTTPHISL
jgi:hypothetical protein